MSTDHVKIISFDNNPNLGLYAFATDKFCLLGVEVHSKHDEDLERVLKVPIHRITIAGTSLIGAFCAGNSECLLIPNLTFDYELKALDELGIKYEIIDTKLTALGNNLTATNKAAVINPEFTSEEEKQIKDALKVRVKKSKISGFENVGSCMVATDKGALVHRDIESFELKFLEDLFQIEVMEGSVNMGNPYVKSGVIANSNGFLIGGLSGGPEITNADEALGFLKK